MRLFTLSPVLVAQVVLLVTIETGLFLPCVVVGFEISNSNTLIGSEIAFIVPHSSLPSSYTSTVSESFDLSTTSSEATGQSLHNNVLHDGYGLPPTSTYLGPPVGAKYESRLRVPVIGTQIFSLHIRSMTHAQLRVAGRLDVNEPVQYSFDHSNGKLHFTLSEQLKSKLRRYLTQLQEVGYDSRTDTPYVKVLPPLPAAIKIILKRV